MLKYNFLFLLFIVMSCADINQMSADELENFILKPEHGLIKTVKQNGYTINVIYRPTDLLINQEISGNDEAIEKEKLIAMRSKYASHYYFILELSKDNREALTPNGNPEEYGNLLNTLSFRMNEYVSLASHRDTLNMDDFVLDRTYGLSSSTNILFVFKNESENIKEEWVQLNVNEFGIGVGDQQFRFNQSDLNNIPSIKFNTTEN